MATAHGLGAGARKVGGAARDLEPEQRRDGVGLFLIALAVVAAAAVWWQLPGSAMDVARTVVSGSVGKVGWLVPVMLVLIGWRNMRDPEHNGPAGRQVIGWLALGFGVLGIVHIASGNPQPQLGDATELQFGGGAIGFVVSSLLLDLLRSAYVVVPLLVLLSTFGVLVITATPVYQVRCGWRTCATRCSAAPTSRTTSRPSPYAAALARVTTSTPRWATPPTTARCSPTAS
jgi:S-DNA-T family DNA segregation ATPase FtsK/SpoIIIE